MAHPSSLFLGPRTWTSAPAAAPASSVTSDAYTHTCPSRRRAAARSLILTWGMDVLSVIRESEYRNAVTGPEWFRWRSRSRPGLRIGARRLAAWISSQQARREVRWRDRSRES